jgi:penicillin-binding protein 1A
VLDPDVARTMVEMMKGVISDGTGRSLRSTYGLTCDLAGKTGTTNDNTDGWFIGYTPTLVAGCWVGNDNPAIHFRTTAYGQGAHTALPIFGKFMGSAQSDPRFGKYTNATFSELPDYIASSLECDYFSETEPKKGFLESIFGRKEEATSDQVQDVTPDKPAPKSAEEKQGLLERMKGLFKKN